MIEILFTIIICAVIAHHAWESYLNNKKQEKLVNSLIAKNANEMTTLTLADQTKVIAEKPTGQSDLIPTDEMNDEQFQTMIDNENRVVEETADLN